MLLLSQILCAVYTFEVLYTPRNNICKQWRKPHFLCTRNLPLRHCQSKFHRHRPLQQGKICFMANQPCRCAYHCQKSVFPNPTAAFPAIPDTPSLSHSESLWWTTSPESSASPPRSIRVIRPEDGSGEWVLQFPPLFFVFASHPQAVLFSSRCALGADE